MTVARFEKHVFVCQNERGSEDLRGCCMAAGAVDILDRLKGKVHEMGLKKKIRVNKAGCLDQCEKGVAIVVYPEGVWYQCKTAADADEILERHLVGGAPVARLRTDA